jgi:hypothetical protein
VGFDHHPSPQRQPAAWHRTDRYANKPYTWTSYGHGDGPAGRTSAGRYSVTSCDLRVLVDQSTESISSRNPSARQDDRWFGGPERWCLPQGAVRTVAVVLIEVLGQHSLQLPASQDQHPVKQLTPDGADPPLRVGIHPRCPHRRPQHPQSLGSKDRIERYGELRIPIPDQNRNWPTRSSRPMTRLRACWVTHSPTGCDVTPSTWTRRVATSITNSTFNRCNKTVSTVKKSTANTPAACARRMG